MYSLLITLLNSYSHAFCRTLWISSSVSSTCFKNIHLLISSGEDSSGYCRPHGLVQWLATFFFYSSCPSAPGNRWCCPCSLLPPPGHCCCLPLQLNSLRFISSSLTQCCNLFLHLPLCRWVVQNLGLCSHNHFLSYILPWLQIGR